MKSHFQGRISYQLYAERIRTNAFGRNPNNASAIISVSVDGLIHRKLLRMMQMQD